MAARDADAEVQQIEIVKRSVAARVRQAHYRLAYTYAIGDVLDRDHDLLETLLTVSEDRYCVRRAAQQDVIKAQTQLSIHDLLFARVEQERATRERELNALLARPVGAPVGRPADLQLTPFELTLDALVTAAGAHAPLLRREQILIDRSQLAVDAARRDYKPDFTVSGGYYIMGSMPPMYEFRFDVQIPLQRARRAAAVAERVSGVQRARSTYDSARLDLQNRIQNDYRMAATSARLARLYHDTVVPQARLALESSMPSYQTGAVDFLSVVTNFSAVLEYEMRYFDELAAYDTAVSRLEERTGTPIPHEGVMKVFKIILALALLGVTFAGGYVLRATRYPAQAGRRVLYWGRSTQLNSARSATTFSWGCAPPSADGVARVSTGDNQSVVARGADQDIPDARITAVASVAACFRPCQIRRRDAQEGGGMGGDVYRPVNGIRSPRLLLEVKPNYTADALRVRIQGLVEMEAAVMPDGSVGRVRITRSLDPVFGLDQRQPRRSNSGAFDQVGIAGSPSRLSS